SDAFGDACDAGMAGKFGYTLLHLNYKMGTSAMTDQSNLGGEFTLPATSISLKRMGYGAMQLAGPRVFGPPKDRDAAVAVLRDAVEQGVNHIDTSDFYGPHITNQIIKEALHPYPDGLLDNNRRSVLELV
ncbi:MAG: aldo/keto reductase, partial [Acetobacteraceae bacterium]